MSTSRPLALATACALGLATLLVATFLFRDLAYPLMWEGEAVTAMYGQRVLEYGVPRVDDGHNAIYDLPIPLSEGTREGSGAYVGAPWLPYYFAAAIEPFAARGDDWAERTGRLRVPFALAGAAGLALWLAALWPLLGATRARRQLAATGYLLLIAASISLVLHLREVAYDALALLLVYAALAAWLRRHVLETLRPRAYGVGAAICLFLLFNTFHAAFVALCAFFLLHAIVRLRRSEDGLGGLAIDVAPLVAAGLAVTPLVAFYDVFGVAAALERALAVEGVGAGSRLLESLAHLMRYEWLAAVLAARVAALVTRVATRREPVSDEGRRRRRVADALGAFALIYLVVVTTTFPVFYERHAVLLSPLLAALLVLDTVGVAERLSRSPGFPRRLAAVGLGIVAIVVAIGLSTRVPGIRGHANALRDSYRGPLEHTFGTLNRRFDDLENLVIATNSEGAPYAYYLGCRVLIGSQPTHLVRDFLFQPGVILPRLHSRNQSHLGRLGVRRPYDQTDMSVRNLPVNNVPSLSDRNPIGVAHRFDSPDLPQGRAGLPMLYLP
jgi:hypothetical protein